MKRRYFALFVALWALNSGPNWAIAAPIHGGTATYEYFNSFFTRLFPGTPFNPGPDPVDVLVESRGEIEEVWQDQVGDSIDFEIVSIVANGELPGMPPVPFQILGGIQQTPQLGPFLGSYTQIVQDPTDPGFATGNPSSLVSAMRFAAGPFAQVFANGTFLYGSAPYAFESTIKGLPYPVGSEFIGTMSSEVPIHVQLGATPDPTTDPQIGLALPGGYVQITRVVPEPAVTVLFLAAIAVTGPYRRRHGFRTSQD